MESRKKWCYLVSQCRCFLALFLISFFFSHCATTISGKLLNQEGKPLTGISGKINVVDVSGGSDHQGNTSSYIADLNQDGSFSVKINSTLGEDFLIEALVPGYNAESKRIKITESKKVDLTLTQQKISKLSTVKLNENFDQSQGGGGVNLEPPKF